MRIVKLLSIVSLTILFYSCEERPKVVNSIMSKGDIITKHISNTPKAGKYGMTISEGAKRIYLKNTSRNKKYEYTIKKVVLRNGYKIENKFDSYVLSPGEEKEIGVDKTYFRNSPNETIEIADIVIVGEIKIN